MVSMAGLILCLTAFDSHAQTIPAPVWHTDGQKLNAGVGADVFVNRPDDVMAGDMIVLFFTQTKTTTNASTSGFSTPTGFQRIHTEHATGSESRPEVVAFYKIAGSSEPYTYESVATDFSRVPLWKALAVRVTGQDSDDPIAALSGNNSGSSSVGSLSLPSLTTTQNNSLLVMATGVRRSISDVAVPTNMTQQWFANGTGDEDDSSNSPALFGATQVLASAEASGNRLSSWTGQAQATGLMFAINPNPINADLKIEIESSPAPHYFADSITITIRVSNLSTTTDASNVKVNFMLPAGLGYVSHLVSSGSCIPASGLWNVGTLAASTVATNTVVASIVCDETNYSGYAVISAKEFDTDNSNNTAYLSIVPQTGGSNACPVIANDDMIYGTQGQPVSMNVLINDRGDFDASTLEILTYPSNGNIQLLPNGEIQYLPNGNFTGLDMFTYRVCNTDKSLCDKATVYITVQEDFISPCLEATRSKTFYLPFPENTDQLKKAFFAAGSNDTGGASVRNVISIKVPYPKTTIVYDHWEDGYEADITVPVQSTTQVWGDGDLSNGVAPGYPDDIIPAGGYIILDHQFAYNPRVQSSIQYDGKDKLFTTNNVFITKVTGDIGRFDVQNVKTDVLDVSRFGKIFNVGFGEDITQPNSLTAFRYVSLFIRAATDSTVVSIDVDGTGTNIKTALLNEGEVWFYNGVGGTGSGGRGVYPNDTNKPDDIKSTAVVTASEPVGVDVLFGDISTYGTRNIYLLPSKFNASEYITPVHTTNTKNEAPVVAFFTNNGTEDITVNWETGSGANGSFPIAAGKYSHHELSLASGYRFKSSKNEPFTAMVVIDADNNGTAYDWAYPMVPVEQLTNYAGLAWAPGSNDGSKNYNPIWVTALEATTIYIKWDGNMSDTGPNISPCGFPYDESKSIDALESLRIFNNATNDQTGTAIFTCGVPIAAVWGQDAGVAETSSPAMDVGYVMQPGCLDHLIVANDDMEVTEPGESVVIDVLGNDGSFLCSLDKSSLSTKGLLQPEHGSVVINSDGSLTYTPHNDSWTGVDYFEYSLCAFEYPNTCDIATVTIKVLRCEDIAIDAGGNIVKGRVFFQLNPDDGTYNGDERLEPGVRVDLYLDLNKDEVVDPGDELLISTTTDANGRFNFVTRGTDYASDDFNAASASYNLNTGSVDWSGAWTRSDNTRVQSVVDATPDNSTNRALRINGSNQSASRGLLFTNATGAALKFCYRKNLSAQTNRALYVTLNGHTIYTIDGEEGNEVDPFYTNKVFTIDAAYFNANGANTLEFKTSGNTTNSDNFYIDNIELIYFPANFIAVVSDLNEAYLPALLNKAAYSFDGLGNCSGNQYLGVLARMVAVDDSENVLTDTPTKINVLANDQGHPNPTSVVITTPPTHGTAVVHSDGSITYTPDPGYNGLDEFQYSVCSIDDPTVCSSNPARVSLNVQCMHVPDKNIINGMVFGDIDLNGTFDAGEKGIAGIAVEMYEGSNLIQTTTTSSLGAYQFELDCIGGTYLDQFNTNGSGAGSDGTKNWSSPWTEIGETNGFGSANVYVTSNRLRINGNGATSQIGAQRTANLSGATSATLTFSYAKNNFNNNNHWVVLEISSSPTGTFTQLAQYVGSGNTSGTASFDISAYISANTTIRFLESTNANMATNRYMTFDDIQITFEKAATNYTVQLATPLNGYDLTTSPSSYVVPVSGCENASCSNNFGLGASDLSISKTVDNDEQYLGENVVFTLVVTNDGPSNNTGVVAVDLPPSGYQYISDDGAGAYDPSSGEWDIGVLAANTSDTLRIILKVLDTGNFINTATVSGDLPDPNPNNSTGSSTVSPEPWTDLKIEKTISNNPVQEVRPFTYTIMVTNLGPLTASDVVVTEVFDTALDSIIRVTPSTGSWDAPEWTIGSLDPTDTATLIIECVLPMYSGIDSLTNTAMVRSDTHDKNFANNTSTVSVAVEVFSGNFWQGNKDHNWGDPANWTAGYVPLVGDDIEFATTGNYLSAAQRDLHLDSDRVIGDLINSSDKDLVITAGNKLSILGRVQDDNALAGGIVIKADQNPNLPVAAGTLIFDDPGKNTNVEARVEFYNQAYSCDNCGYYRKQWQYFGIPVKESAFPYQNPVKELVNQWVETFNGNKWQAAPYTPDLVLKAFKAYEITNTGNTRPTHMYEFSGVLNVGDASMSLSKTSNVNYSGTHILANSFTAALPIDTKSISYDGNWNETVYLFNTGTRDQWRKLNGATLTHDTQAGQYKAIPLRLAGQAGLDDHIPAMHSFLINIETAGTLTLDYASLSKNTLVDGKAWRAAKQELPYIVMDIIGDTSADRVWLFEVVEATTGFDKGWDGHKYLENDIVQVYVEGEGTNQYQVAAVPELIGSVFGLKTRHNELYTLSLMVSPAVAIRDLYLRDMTTGCVYPLQSQAEYELAGRPNSSTARFEIMHSSQLGDMDQLSADVYVAEKTIVVVNHADEDGLVNIYDLSGKLLESKQVLKGSTAFFNEASRLPGVYLVKIKGEQQLNQISRVMVQ